MVVVRFVAPDGTMLMEQSHEISNSGGVGVADYGLVSVTKDGQVPVVPVLWSDAGTVTLDGQEPVEFTYARADEVGLDRSLLDAILRK